MSAPPPITNSSTADFDFDTNASSAIYQCSLDSAPFANCPDPYQITNVPEGSHTLAVRAVAGGASSHPDPTPATHDWTTDYTPPETTITGGPSGLTTAVDPTFEFSSSESSGGFECAIDSGAYATCSSPHPVTGLSDGDHTFRVRALDPAGNVDPTPAERAFLRDTSGPATPTLQIVPAPASRRGGGRARSSAKKPSTATSKVQVQSRWLVKWSGGAGTVNYDISYLRIPAGSAPDEVAPTAWRNDTTNKKGTFTAAAGFTYCFRAVANDDLGNGSVPREVCTAMPHRAKKLRRTSGWQVTNGPAYYLGGYVRWPGGSGGVLGAALEPPVGDLDYCELTSPNHPSCVGDSYFQFCHPAGEPFDCDIGRVVRPTYVKRIVLVATKCPSCGTVRARGVMTDCIDDSLGFDHCGVVGTNFQKSVDLTSATTKKKQRITLKVFGDPAASSLDHVYIEVLSGKPRIEGLALTSPR